MNDELRQALDNFYQALHAGKGRAPKHCGLFSQKPKLSDALGVHSSQVEEATESAKKHGVPTEFTPDGRPIIRSRAHQKAYLKAYGFVNKDGGYGD